MPRPPPVGLTRRSGRADPEHLVVLAVAGGDVEGAVRAGAHGAQPPVGAVERGEPPDGALLVEPVSTRRCRAARALVSRSL